MKISTAILAIGSAIALVAIDMIPSVHVGIIGNAQAVVGRPLTPISYAGVARRTTRRAVYATSAAAAAHPTTVVVSTPSAVVAVGTVVYSLPSGCVVRTINGIGYHACGSLYYRATYYGNDLVYVVAQP